MGGIGSGSGAGVVLTGSGVGSGFSGSGSGSELRIGGNGGGVYSFVSSHPESSIPRRKPQTVNHLIFIMCVTRFFKTNGGCRRTLVLNPLFIEFAEALSRGSIDDPDGILFGT